MTSKENIKLIRELYDYAMWDFHKGNLDEMTDKDVAVGKAIDNVEKDLEALDILKEETLLDFINYLNKSLKGNIDETVNIMWIHSQLTNYLKENDL